MRWFQLLFNEVVEGIIRESFYLSSAGIGRTGTFIAMDNLVAQGLVEGVVRPLQMVEALRRQRVNMVQTKVCVYHTGQLQTRVAPRLDLFDPNVY